MISCSKLGKFFGEQTLFRDVSIQFNPGERYGIVGANGSGKSTFLKVLSGDEIASEGEVSLPKRARIGVLKQDHFQYEDNRILDVVMMGNAELWRAMVEKEKLLENADQEFDGERYAELEDIVMRHDGYALESRAGEILEGLGIPTERHLEPLSALSGGFKLRVLLAQVLAAEPDVLFLDEPTNHLDILSIRWLEKFLQEYKGTTLVISHDHRFLDNVSTMTVDVDYETITLYRGNYSKFLTAKVEDRERREQAIERQEKKKAEHQAFVDRFKAKATKARQAQSKVKLIEKMEIEELPQTSRRYPIFQFQQCRPSGKQVLTIEGITKSYDDHQVLHGIDLEVGRSEKIAIIGPNGIGKSTLLKIAVGQLGADGGELEWGYETHVGYFAQDHKEQLGDSKQSVEAWLWDICPGEPIGFVRGKLGQVLFSGDEVKKKISALSGGEAARLIFCKQMVEKPNILVLDEPTNHLDLEAIEALVGALAKFDGTLIFVSHDRWFVSKLATRIVEITEAGVRDFKGTYEEYLEKLGDDHLDADAVLKKARADKRKAKEEKRNPRSEQELREQRNQASKLRKRSQQITSEIEKKEQRVGEINDIFCDPSYFEKTPQKEISKVEREQKDLQAKIDELMAEWERIEGELEEMTAD